MKLSALRWNGSGRSLTVRQTEYALRRACRQCMRLTGRESFHWWDGRRKHLLLAVSAWRKLTPVEQFILRWSFNAKEQA